MSDRTLVYIIHCDPTLGPNYKRALADVGLDADVVCVVGPPPGLSSRYDRLVAECRLGGESAMDGLAKRYKPPQPLKSYDRRILAAFSAGYAFARGLDEKSIAMLSALVLIDSGHTDNEKDGTANDAGVEWLRRWAMAARGATKVLAIGHTDVDPVAYASTTKVAAEVVRLSGKALDEMALSDADKALGVVRRGRDGYLLVESYNRRPPSQAQGEHGDALRVWGDELVAWAAAQAWTAENLNKPLEPRLNPDFVATQPLVPPPTVSYGSQAIAHGYRCSVSELVADARATGSWHPASEGYIPRRGDLIVSGRNGGDPTKGGEGHVEGALETATSATGTVPTLGANESNTWVRAPYDLSSKDYKGTIEREAPGVHALEIAERECEAKIAEVAGVRHNPQIQAYHAGARRGGSALAGMPGHETEGELILGKAAPDEVSWCASAQSWCLYEAVRRSQPAAA